MALLQVSDLRVDIHTHRGSAPAVRDMAFTLERGDTLGLIGESGCGKSMTALAVMGLLPHGAQAQGRITFDGQDLLRLPEAALCTLRGRRIGMIFQEPMTALNPVMSIGDQVAEVLVRHHRMNRQVALARARERLDRVGLPRRAFP